MNRKQRPRKRRCWPSSAHKPVLSPQCGAHVLASTTRDIQTEVLRMGDLSSRLTRAPIAVAQPVRSHDTRRVREDDGADESGSAVRADRRT